MNRNYTFDYVRGVAIIMIVTCHFFLFGGSVYGNIVGGFLGGTGNFLFFSISALIFGVKLDESGGG